jgi:hypothetical protein
MSKSQPSLWKELKSLNKMAHCGVCAVEKGQYPFLLFSWHKSTVPFHLNLPFMLQLGILEHGKSKGILSNRYSLARESNSQLWREDPQPSEHPMPLVLPVSLAEAPL